MKQCTEASHSSLSSSTELRRKNSSAHWPEKEHSLFMVYHSKHRHIHKHTLALMQSQLYKIFTVDCTCSLYCTHTQIFVGSPGFSPESERGYWWTACDVNYAVCMSRARCKHIFVRPTVMTVYTGHIFVGRACQAVRKIMLEW